MIQTRIITLLAALAAVFSATLALRAQQPQKSVLDGAYTESQAERGEAAYTKNCARCHGGNLDGIGAAPMLYSARFIDRWREDSLSGLFDYIKVNMPLDAKPAPGGLPESDYLDITAYLLYESEYPYGTKDLTAADLDKTLLVGLDGPKPLPPASLVRVVGCLTQTGGAWSLTKGSPFFRTHKGDTTDAAEKAKSAAVPLGTQEVRLPNLADDFKAADLTPQVSKKVQVKGVYNVTGTAARVNVLSFEPLGQACP